MTRQKKTGSRGFAEALFIGTVALLASIAMEVWLGVLVFAAVGVALYLYSRSSRAQVPAAHALPQRPVPRPAAPVTQPPTRTKLD